MKRNSTQLELITPGATTWLPWISDLGSNRVDGYPSFDGFAGQSRTIREAAWQAFLDSEEDLEIIPVPEPPAPTPEPDWDALRLGLIASTTITNWFESVPALLQNDMAAQIQTQQLDKLLQGLSLTDYSAVKDELNQLLASCNFDLVLT